MRRVAAVDIGGTQLRAALVDEEARIHRRAARPVASPQDGEALTGQVVTLLRELMAGLPRPVAAGVSLPAVIDRRTGRVEWAPNLPGWDGTELGPRLSEALAMPVVLEYDGHAAALGEHWAGAGRGVDDLVFVIVGTGVGGGIIAGGQLVRGASNLAGAGGWMGVPGATAADPARAAARGLLESLIAGPALQATASRRLGEPLAPRDIFDRAARGDLACRAIVDEAREHLAWALSNVVSLLNPALVLVGGSVGLRLAEQPQRLEAAVRDRAQPWAARRARIAPAGLGDDAGLLGAARAALSCVGG